MCCVKRAIARSYSTTAQIPQRAKAVIVPFPTSHDARKPGKNRVLPRIRVIRTTPAEQTLMQMRSGSTAGYSQEFLNRFSNSLRTAFS
jgi:hypothetical protein